MPGFNCITGPNGSGKCLRGDSLVQLSNGERKAIADIVNEAFEKSDNIEELDDGFIVKDNPTNVEVLSLNSETLLIEKKKVAAFVKRKCPENLIKIKTRSGKEIVSTDYHPVFTFRDGELIALKASELKPGLKIATPRFLDVNCDTEKLSFANTFSNDDKLYLPYSSRLENFIKSLIKEFGGIKKLSQLCDVPYTIIKSVLNKRPINVYYLSKILRRTGKDFCFDKLKSKTSHKSFITPFKLTNELARFLGYIIADGSSLKSTHRLRFVNQENNLLNDFSYIANSQFGLTSSIKSYKPTTHDSIIYSKPLQIFLEKVFGINLGQKFSIAKVPKQIFVAPNSIKSHFLAGLIDCGGYVNVVTRGNKHQCYVEYSTTSKTLAEDVSTLLLSLGIIGFVKERRKCETNSKKRKVKTYYSVIIYGLRNLRKFVEAVPLRSKKVERLKEITKWEIEYRNNLDVIPGCTILIKRLVKELGIKIKNVKSKIPKLAAYYEGRCNATRSGLLEIVEFVTENYSLTFEAKSIIKKLLLLANSDIFWDEVVSVEKIKTNEDWVYDLCIDENHNFLANNVIVHNSNILDAVAFALGRTSAKSMRADRLNELIFHGSGTKKPAEYASVSLYFDNSKKVFPSDENEVVITRKVNKSGVSVFKLNGKTVNKEKILEFLSSARIYPEGHNIVLQGDVTEIIENSPIERRLVIDEISGIAEYSEKKEKAMKDLEAVDEKLKEAEIIINERYEIFKRLESESSAAIKYQNLQKRLQILKASLAKKKLEIAEVNHKKILESIEKLEKEINNINKELEDTEKGIAEIDSELRRIGNKIIEISKILERNKEASEIRTKLLIKKDRLSSNLREIERLDDIIKRLQVIESKRLEFLEALPTAVKAILDAKINGVYGVIANLIKVDENNKLAIEVAAGNHLYDLVVENDDVAKFCIDYLKREKIGRAVFLPLNKIRAQKIEDKSLLKKPGVIGLASELIEYDRKFATAIDFIFANTLVVEDLEVAKSIGIGRVRMVTLDGDLIEKSGVMIGGWMPREKTPKLEENISDYIEIRNKLKEETEILSKEIVELENLLKKYPEPPEVGALSELEKTRIDLEGKLDLLNGRRRSLYEKKLSLQSELNKLNIQKAKIEADLESLKIEVQQYGQIEYIDEKVSTLEQQINKTFEELNALGPVNFKAIEEFERFKTEFDSYKEKYVKILEEKNAVLKMIDEIEQKRKEVFYKCLNELSKHFNEIFNKMTGGTASLSLENPEDLESGLLIEANPFGKKLVNIDSLSGGEKSLVALAFIFAIQKYRPAPFYILDEIDAALDKENSEKVAKIIKEFSKDAQFIIISHNDATLKYADRLYGVTMIDGESKIVGLELPGK
jgi:chromosome segregation protein